MTCCLQGCLLNIYHQQRINFGKYSYLCGVSSQNGSKIILKGKLFLFFAELEASKLDIKSIMIHTDPATQVTAVEVPDILLAPIIVDCVPDSASMDGEEFYVAPSTSSCTSPTSPVSPSTSGTASMTDEDLGSVDGLIDATLAQAAISAVETGSLTPLIKEELRCAIQHKRLSEGKEELTPEEPPAPKKRKVDI